MTSLQVESQDTLTIGTLKPVETIFESITGRRPGVATVWRWRNRGLLRNGRRVKLRTVRVFKRLCTTEAEARRFLLADQESQHDGERRAVGVSEDVLRGAGLL